VVHHHTTKSIQWVSASDSLGSSSLIREQEQVMTGGKTGGSTFWSMTLGVILIILGVIALVSPVFATQTLMQMMGWLLIVAAIEQAIHAFQHRGEGGLFYKVFFAALYAVVAVMLLRRPASGAVAATVIIGFLFLLDGIAEIALAVRTRRDGRRSGWLFLGGAVSLLFAGIVLYGFPSRALWTIGVLVGIRLVVKGIEQITSSLPVAKTDIERPGGLKRVA
jgi:uncharacterized membrane protein HdeD (DUF308 family)